MSRAPDNRHEGTVYGRTATRALISLTVAAALLSSGCVYLHNEADAEKARGLAQTFRSFETNSGGVYNVMLNNAKSVETERLKLLERDAAARVEAFAIESAGTTFLTVQTNIAELLEEAQNSSSSLTNAAGQIEKTEAVKRAELPKANASASKLKEQVEAAETEKLKWTARQLFFGKLLEFYTGHATNIGNLDKATLTNLASTVLNAPITEATNVTVSDVLKNDFNNIDNLDLALKGLTIDLFNPSKAPGITVEILSLGSDLAQLQVAKLDLELDRLKQHLVSVNARQAIMQRLQGRLQNASNTLSAFRDVPEKATIIDLFQATPKEMDRIALANALLQYAVAATIEVSEFRREAIRPSIIDHEYSVRLSRFNAQEKEAVIARATESLRTYYEHGLKPEHIANLLSAAQAAGIGVIGARLP